MVFRLHHIVYICLLCLNVSHACVCVAPPLTEEAIRRSYDASELVVVAKCTDYGKDDEGYYFDLAIEEVYKGKGIETLTYRVRNIDACDFYFEPDDYKYLIYFRSLKPNTPISLCSRTSMLRNVDEFELVILSLYREAELKALAEKQSPPN